jgi:hypothetical protein
VANEPDDVVSRSCCWPAVPTSTEVTQCERWPFSSSPF